MKNISKWVRIISLIVLISSIKLRSYGQEIQTINAYLDSVVEASNIPAISAGIVVDGEAFWSGASGMLDIENQLPATSKSIFRIGSISKVLTATAVMKLAEQGRIDLDAPIQKYIPDFPESKKGTITIFHLLSLTSGIKHYQGDENRSFVNYENLRSACRVFESRKLKFTPGTKYLYSSYSYTALGAVIEAATNKSFFDVMSELVLKPAGMSQTGLDNRKKPKEGTAKLYAKAGDKIVPDVDNDLSIIYPGGGLVSTAEDMMKFIISWEKEMLISQESMQKMIQPVRANGQILDDNAALGWNIWQHKTLGQVYHRVGGQSGTSALLISYADDGVAVILLSNQAVLNPIWEITNRLLRFGSESRE